MPPKYYSNKYKTTKGDFTVFVCNISFQITEEEVKHIFENVATVTKFKMVNKTNEEGRVVKRFAFITFDDYDSMQNALRIDGYCVDDRNLVVRQAEKRDRHNKSKFNDYRKSPVERRNKRSLYGSTNNSSRPSRRPRMRDREDDVSNFPRQSGHMITDL